MTTMPRQGELLLPLLQVLHEHPDGLKAADAVTAVAEKLQFTAAQQHARQGHLPNGKPCDLFGRALRWTRQKAKDQHQLDGKIRNLWRLTPKGQRDLRFATPGIVISVFQTDNGRAVWAEAEAAIGDIQDGSVNLWLTSPPYPLQWQKAYGNFTGQDYIGWLLALCSEMKRTLAEDGSLVINLGDAFLPGKPVLDLYQERLLIRLCDELGFHLAQRLIWHNPAKLPVPAEWVSIRRCRVTPATESLFWLAKSPHPAADNRRVLRSYSAATISSAAAARADTQHRPSGHRMKPSMLDTANGGSIPHNLITAPHTASNDTYQAYCRSNHLPIHPARFPAKLAEFPIRLLTQEGDLVADCFAGSCTTGAVAQQLNRRWICIEQSLTYLRGAVGRFPGATEIYA